MEKVNVSDFFVSSDIFKEVSDGKHSLVLCHYPLLTWKHEEKSYMVHGHIHNSTDLPYRALIKNNPRLLNAGADVNGFEPVSFDEMAVNNARFKIKL